MSNVYEQRDQCSLEVQHPGSVFDSSWLTHHSEHLHAKGVVKKGREVPADQRSEKAAAKGERDGARDEHGRQRPRQQRPMQPHEVRYPIPSRARVVDHRARCLAVACGPRPTVKCTGTSRLSRRTWCQRLRTPATAQTQPHTRTQPDTGPTESQRTRRRSAASKSTEGGRDVLLPADQLSSKTRKLSNPACLQLKRFKNEVEVYKLRKR